MASALRSRARGRTEAASRFPSGRVADGSASRARSPVTFQLRAHSGPHGATRLRGLVLIELAAALPLTAWVVDPVLVAPAALAAAVLVLFAVVRRHRRPWSEWLVAAQGLRARRDLAARSPVPPGTDPSFAPAVECDPALRTYACATRDRRQLGMVGDGTFVTAVLQIESDSAPLRDGRGQRPLQLGLVRDTLEVDDIRLESAQIVLHTQPAPALHLPRESVAVSNYAPLHAQSGAPAVRITWIALKLDPELCPEAVAARGGGLLGAQRCLVRAVDHLASRLSGAGFRATPLSEEGLASAIATSACANPLVTAEAGRAEEPPRRTEETPHAWRCDNRRHTSYWVRRWPRLGETGDASLPRLVATLTAVPTLATTFSLTLGRAERQEVALRGHVRVTGRSEAELAAAREAVERAARRTGTALTRLDRQQLPGMLATLPLGGTR
ncbi:type VII secretion protein EccE [Streptomyces sp. NPDC023327]|uniref:type VII secretion protein EccE n=1 Tax=Streptomyces sp. NPDC023327 TaxID=3157088 RepID=UPI0033E1C35B